MQSTPLQWVNEELSSVSLGDKRRNYRLIDLTIRFALNLDSSIRHAMEDHKNTMAAYRFFKNPNIHSDAILAPHIAKTNARIEQCDTVVIIHDTVSFDFTDHQTMTGLGIIGGTADKSAGLIAHHCLATDLEGVPLGILTQQVIARQKSKISSSDYPNCPIEQKETYRWIDSLIRATPEEQTYSKAIHICDREADFFEFLEQAIAFNRRFVIRARWNRVMGNKEKLKGMLKERALKKASIIAIIEGNGEREEKKIKCELYAASLTVPGPHNSKKKKHQKLQLNCVWVRSEESSSTEQLEWILWTNEPIETEEQVLKVLKYYRLRPLIEEFHKILKSGLNMEKCGLNSADKFSKYLALKSVIAWRLFRISRVGRGGKEQSCESIFAPMEWQILWIRVKKTKPPQIAPKLQEVILLLACLGGYANRKNDRPPGIVVTWRGWQRLYEAIETYVSIQEANVSP